MKEQVLSNFSSYITYLQKLERMQASLFDLPIKEGKWSVKEIISHIYCWDLHFLEHSIPRVLKEREINYPSYHDFNKNSEVYSKTVEIKALLKESIKVRKQLLHQLTELDIFLYEPITINGYKHCPRRNIPYTLMIYIIELVEHDDHHVKQIEKFITSVRT